MIVTEYTTVYTLTEAVKYFNDQNYHMTKGGLRFIMKQHPNIFYKSHSRDYHSEVYKDEIDLYINRRSVIPSKDMLTVPQASKEYKISFRKLYEMVSKKKIYSERIGKGNGRIYVRREDVEQLRKH